jgi:hypothetical protein
MRPHQTWERDGVPDGHYEQWAAPLAGFKLGDEDIENALRSPNSAELGR